MSGVSRRVLLDYTLQAMREIAYNRWREYDPVATCASTRSASMKQG
jgi:hypothetical protein